ncbi:MAG: hypothetical protein RL088_668 [Verrucomicrobiota bacterium]
MTYLQPWSLWLLALCLLPIIIHMLNRLRYKTVQWAAMYFLLKANKAATKRAKLKQYLLLLFRALAVLFLIWAMMRPQVGGWLGKNAGGAPEVIVVMLDRSASMEARVGSDRQDTKRQQAIALLSEASKDSQGSRFVVIENVLRQPLEVADLKTLATMQNGEPTDSAADIPAMFRTAVEYLVKNKPGSAEIWLASDLQKSNWRDESAEWQDITARINALPETHIRVIDLSSAPGTNLAIAVKAAEFRPSKTAPEKGSLVISLETRAGGSTGTFPLKVTRDGATSQSDLVLNSPVRREALKYDIAALPEGGGWGKFELPVDENDRDNATYFTYRQPVPLRAAVVSDLSGAKRIAFAAAPDKSRLDRTADIVPPGRTTDLKWKELAMIVWQGAAPTDALAKQLLEFAESGGVVVAFPAGGDSGNGPLGITWSAAENTKEPFRIANWDELDGPLARTDNGASLPVGRIELTRRQVGRIAGDKAHVFGVFADGQPFLTGQQIGAGHVFVCSAAPDPEWGSFGDGFVLLPMMQRLLVQGGTRLAPPALAAAGDWKPQDGDVWTSVETDRRRDPRWHSGVYKHAGRLIALNRPESEDSPDFIDAAAVKKLMPGAKLEVMSGVLTMKADRLRSEIWPLMIVATMLFMILEMLLATSKALIPQKPKPKVPVAAAAPKKQEASV